MGDVFIGIAAGRDLAVHPFEGTPAPAVVIRGAEDQPPSGDKHPVELAEYLLVRRNVLDHLGADHTIEGGVLEGQLEDGAVHERVAIAAGITELAEDDVQPDQLPGADDAARSATDVENPLSTRRQP